MENKLYFVQISAIQQLRAMNKPGKFSKQPCREYALQLYAPAPAPHCTPAQSQTSVLQISANI